MATEKGKTQKIELTEGQVKHLEFTEREIANVSIQHQTLMQLRGKLISSYAQELKVPRNWQYDEEKRIFTPPKERPKEPPIKPEVPRDGE